MKTPYSLFPFPFSLKLLFVHGLLFISLSSQSQNLIPNWSFEDTIYCPGTPFCGGVSCTYYWYSPTPNTPDYYHACSYWHNVPGNFDHYFQYAKHGQAYAGVFMWALSSNLNKEYIQVELQDTLVRNKSYCGGFWICKAEGFKYAVRNAGMYVSKEQIGSPIVTYLEYTPQINYTYPQYLTDTANWVLVSGSFQAQGGEKYVTIGNFNHITDSLLCDTTSWKYNIAYYLIDAVFLYDCSQTAHAYAGSDATICGPETAHIGEMAVVGYTYQWAPASGLSNDTIPNPIAQPAQTTTYVLSMTDEYYQVTTDTVTVTVTTDCLPINSVDYIPNIFTPNGDSQNDIFRVRGQNIRSLTLQIYSRWGNLVFNGNEPNAAWDGTYNGKACADGVYYYVAEIGFMDGKTEMRKGSVTLVR